MGRLDVVTLDQHITEMDADAPFHSAVAGNCGFRSAANCCSAKAHSTAPTTEANSIRNPSPSLDPPEWREFDPEDTIRWYALRLRETGLIKSTPQQIIADSTDWRFLDEVKRELKA